MKYRLLGLLLFGIGAMLAKYTVYDPLAAIAYGAGAIKVYSLGAVVVPLMLVFGAGFILLGRRALTLVIDEGEDTMTNFGFVTVIALIACGIFLKVWMGREIEHTGYRSPVAAVTPAEPLSIQFKADVIEAYDGQAQPHAIAWADMSEIDIMAGKSASSGGQFQMYWKFSGKEGDSIHVPFTETEKGGVLGEITQHVGSVQGDPIREMQTAMVMAPGRPQYVQVVWKR
jgi:hypothetical protein